MKDRGFRQIRRTTHRPLKIIPPLFLPVFLLSCLISFAPPVLGGQTITIGLVPEMNVFAQMQRFQPLADYLGRETGIEIKLFMLYRYGEILDRFQSGEIDGAFLGSYTAAQAITQLKAQPVARPINLDNSSTYQGLIFVRKDSGINNAKDMREKTMAFVERATTAGYVFPVAWLKKQGIANIATFFKDHYFTGSHDAAIAAVLNGKADIGAAKNTIYELYLASNPGAQKELAVIASSPPVPSNGLCVLPTVSEETLAKLETALLALDRSSEGRTVLEKLRAVKFVKTTVSDYKPVFDMAADAGIDLTAAK